MQRVEEWIWENFGKLEQGMLRLPRKHQKVIRDRLGWQSLAPLDSPRQGQGIWPAPPTGKPPQQEVLEEDEAEQPRRLEEDKAEATVLPTQQVKEEAKEEAAALPQLQEKQEEVDTIPPQDI